MLDLTRPVGAILPEAVSEVAPGFCTCLGEEKPLLYKYGEAITLWDYTRMAEEPRNVPPAPADDNPNKEKILSALNTSVHPLYRLSDEDQQALTAQGIDLTQYEFLTM